MAKKGLSNSNDCKQRTFTANLLDKYLLVFQAHLKIVENQIKNHFSSKNLPHSRLYNFAVQWDHPKKYEI